MDLQQLRLFVVVAEELHFGRAAQRLSLLPSALGRHIRLLEEDLGTRLFARTTRTVSLTPAGTMLLADARPLLAQADAIARRMREQSHCTGTRLRLGAIDSASAGLVPQLLRDLRREHPEIRVVLKEDKTIHLLPQLLSGQIDLALVRPPARAEKELEFCFLLHETAVVAVSRHSALARCRCLRIRDIGDQPLIVPDRRSRPHSHDLTMKLFAEAGLQPKTVQVADEKSTIVNLVAANIGIAIVPRWTSRLKVPGVKYVPFEATRESMSRLPLAAAWAGGTRDPVRDMLLAVLKNHLGIYAKQA